MNANPIHRSYFADTTSILRVPRAKRSLPVPRHPDQHHGKPWYGWVDESTGCHGLSEACPCRGMGTNITASPGMDRSMKARASFAWPVAPWHRHDLNPLRQNVDRKQEGRIRVSSLRSDGWDVVEFVELFNLINRMSPSFPLTDKVHRPGPIEFRDGKTADRVVQSIKDLLSV